MGVSNLAEAGADKRGWLSPINFGVLVGALVAASLVVVLIFQVAASNSERDRTLELERHSYDVMLVTRSVGTSMAKAEASLGRFATSADRGMGTGYYNAWTDAGAQITRLENLVGKDETELKLVHQLRGLYNARGEELGLTAQRAYYRQGWPALLLFNNAGHSKLIGQIDKTLTALQDHESDKLLARFDR
jgi:CHASE3 domain sensor protein